jgi:acetylornithine/N-succinyldiaminopimelate aminotransferase
MNMHASRLDQPLDEPRGPVPHVENVMPVAIRPEIVMARGQGSWLWDTEGRRYLDLVQGWAVNCLGHSPPRVAAALAEQARTLLNPSPSFYNAKALELAAAVARHTGLDHVFFTSTGAEANEGAIKLARKWGSVARRGAYQIVTLANAFHGRTLATMSASGKAGWDRLFEPKVPGFKKVPAGDLGALRAAVDDATVAVMLEPIQGEAGVVPISLEHLRAIRALTEERGVLLIADEVQTGVGRTGAFLCLDHAGVRADIVTLAKGLGGGVPIGALVARREVSCFAPGDQGGTYNGNPLVCAAALAVLEEVTSPGFLEAVRERGAHLAEGLAALSRRLGLGEVRGAGLLLALDLDAPRAERVVAAARRRGLLVNAPRPGTLRFMPALNVSREDLDEALAILSAALEDPAAR